MIAVLVAIPLVINLLPKGVGYIKVETPGAEICLKTSWFSTKIITDSMGEVAFDAGRS